jgi:lysophospholipase L1-like esterase
LNPATKQPTVIFIGDETTANWPMANHPNWINKGVPGNTTTQMLARFQTDVIDLHPDVVHIMGGWNDILAQPDGGSWGGTFTNLNTMSQMAQTSGIKVIVGSPIVGNGASSFYLGPDLNPEAYLDGMNFELLQNYTLTSDATLADFINYYGANVGGNIPQMDAMAIAQIGVLYGTSSPMPMTNERASHGSVVHPTRP